MLQNVDQFPLADAGNGGAATHSRNPFPRAGSFPVPGVKVQPPNQGLPEPLVTTESRRTPGTDLSNSKRCSSCGTFHDRLHSRYCNDCSNRYMRDWRKTHPLSVEQRRKANVRSYARVYQRRGKLLQQPCEVCGNPNSQKHHDDYSQPLIVRWLCRDHHLQFHALNPSAHEATPALDKIKDIAAPSPLLDRDSSLGYPETPTASVASSPQGTTQADRPA